MASIQVTYSSGGVVHTVSFDKFQGAELARTYAETNNFRRTASGSQVITGLPGRQKFIWAVAAFASEAMTLALDEMFQAWDSDRGAGLPAAVFVSDSTGFKTETASAIFSTAPVYSRFGPNDYQVSFGLAEV